MNELVSVTGAATKLPTETEHKTKLKMTTEPVLEALYTKSQNIEQCTNYWSVSL
jgi:hypothetical protein